MTLGERIVQYRAEHKMTQVEFAKACGLSKPTIFMIEKYDASITALTRAKVELVIGKEKKED